MSSSKTRNNLLIIFVVFTIIFGSLFAYEFFQVQQVRSSSLTTSTTTMTLILSTTSTIVTTETETTSSVVTVPLPDEGLINFGNIGIYSYKRLGDLVGGASVTFKNVTFYSIPITEAVTGCTVRHIRVTFPDEALEEVDVGWCMNPYVSIAFTKHSNPKAGAIFSIGWYWINNTFVSSPIEEGIYLLVSEGS